MPVRHRPPDLAGRPDATRRRLQRLERTLAKQVEATDRLQSSMIAAQRSRLRWKKAFYASAVALLVVSGVTLAAITVTDNSNIEALWGEIFGFDETQFTVTSEVPKPSLGRSASGDSFGGAVEFASTPPTANNGPAALDWEYIVTVTEASDGSVPDPGAEVYKATLYMDGTDMGSLYFDQATQEASTTESVTLVWDLGPSLPAAASFLVDIRLASS